MKIEDCEVGQRITLECEPGPVFEITGIGRRHILFVDVDRPHLERYVFPDQATKVVEYPEVFVNVYTPGVYCGVDADVYRTIEDAEADTWIENAMARVHLHKDGTLTLENLK
jgi:hypothetical protein